MGHPGFAGGLLGQLSHPEALGVLPDRARPGPEPLPLPKLPECGLHPFKRGEVPRLGPLALVRARGGSAIVGMWSGSWSVIRSETLMRIS